MQQRAVERVLEIARSKRSDRLNHFELAQIGGMAHRRAPIPAPDRDAQKLRICSQQSDNRLPVVGPNGAIERSRECMRGDAFLKFGPMRKSILSRDH